MTRWSSFVVARPKLVLAATVLLVLLGGAWGSGVFDRLSLGGYTDPGSESAGVERLIEGTFGRQTPDLAVTYHARPGATIDDLGPEVAAHLAQIDAGMLANTPLSYWSAPPQAKEFLRSTDGTEGLVVLSLSGDENTRIAAYHDLGPLLVIDGTDAEFSGFSAAANAFNEVSESDLLRAEAVSFPLLLLLLLVIFGGLVGAAVPLCVGGLAIIGALGALRVISYFTEVSAFSVNIASLVGLGMSIDYGLFVVTRFREELRSGSRTDDAVRRTLATAGRTVGFSALLLVCGFVGMLVFPQAIVRSFAYGGMAAVGIAAVLSLSALPAALALLGPRINSLTWRPGVVERGEDRAHRFWGGVAARVMRRPVPIATAIVAGLLVLAAPLTGASLGDLDHTGLPAAHPLRLAVDDLATDFPLANNGATLVLQGSDGKAPPPAATAEFFRATAAVDGVQRVVPVGATDTFVAIRAIFDDADRTTGAMATAAALRDLPPPEGTEKMLGGLNALTADGLDAMAAGLPWMIGIMVAVTFVLMLLAFRSVVLPLKAIAMATLSLAASFGVLTWIFEDGHGAEFLGVTPGPLPATMVVLIIAVVFGLSTDYEIFLMSRMVEAHDKGASTEEAVRIGTAHTGRIVTAAAALLIVVTGAFTLSELTMMRFIGLGMIVALLIDATVIRMMLVPALVKLMGEANWWAPGFLARKTPTPGSPEDPKPSPQQQIPIQS
ncbi:MMPL family transporter [Rhodococcus jostii]|uniref:MMPL family transporter n=1 Tax=Rhodococcus jostii TaxID=132919 RepID=UPI00363EBD33